MITIDSVNAETDYGIDGTTKLMTALKSVSDVGKRVVDEVGVNSDKKILSSASALSRSLMATPSSSCLSASWSTVSANDDTWGSISPTICIR